MKKQIYNLDLIKHILICLNWKEQFMELNNLEQEINTYLKTICSVNEVGIPTCENKYNTITNITQEFNSLEKYTTVKFTSVLDDIFGELNPSITLDIRLFDKSELIIDRVKKKFLNLSKDSIIHSYIKDNFKKDLYIDSLTDDVLWIGPKKSNEEWRLDLFFMNS